LVLSVLLAVPVSADLRSNPSWWDQNAVGTTPDWHYRVPITVPAGSPINSTVKVDVDFNALMAAMGIGGTFDVNSPRLVRANGALVAQQEFTDTIYAGATDAANNGRGEIRFILEDTSPATLQLYFDITQNGTKPANPQTPINGNFERGATGTAQPTAWNAPSGLSGLDAQVRPSESVSVSSDGFLALPNPKTTDGTPHTGAFSYLIGARSANETANGSKTITRTFAVPTSSPGNFTIRWRAEGWDAAGFDSLSVRLSQGATTIHVVGSAAGTYASQPYSPNAGTGPQSNSAPGNRPYNNFDMTTTGAHTQGMTVAAQAEPWWTRSVSLAPLAGKTVTLTITSSHVTGYRSWFHIDNVEWSVVTATVGTPQAFGLVFLTPTSSSGVSGTTIPLRVQVDAAPTSPVFVELYNPGGSVVRTATLFNDGTHGDTTAGDAIWTNDGSVALDRLSVPGGATGGWTLRAFARDSSTSTIGVRNGLVRGPGTGAAPETEANYWNIDEVTLTLGGVMLVTKTSSVVSDPFNSTTNPKRIPGAVIQYCVLITNNSNGSLSSIIISDPLPATVTYVPATMRSGATCATALTVEDDNATGPDESDPIGASVTGSTVSGGTASLAKNTAFALTYRVTVK
jgi:uncharacterized repeat protein (TIGR01451 family)